MKQIIVRIPREIRRQSPADLDVLVRLAAGGVSADCRNAPDGIWRPGVVVVGEEDV